MADFYPKFDSPMFAFDAGSVEDDEMELHGPAASPPTSPGTDPWNGPYGYSVVDFKSSNGFNTSGIGGAPGYGSNSPKSWKFDIQLPEGWYTRISRRDKNP